MRVLILLAASAAILNASNPWSKDSSQWSADDVERIFTNSPWAKVAGATFDTPTDDAEQGHELPPGSQSGDSRGATDGKWDGGVSKNSSGTVPTLPVTVRWDSALAMIKASQRSAGSSTGVPGFTEEDLKKWYVITVIGLVPGMNSKHPAKSNPDASAAVDPEQMLSGIQSQSHLLFPNRPSVRPDEVKLDAKSGALRFYFSRSSSIQMTDKEVLFSTHYGRLTVKQRFRLKDMVYKGELEL
ncbi:MAG: hypothetical protein WBW33_14920 [Bryobacteraceae bacterium]